MCTAAWRKERVLATEGDSEAKRATILGRVVVGIVLFYLVFLALAPLWR